MIAPYHSPVNLMTRFVERISIMRRFGRIQNSKSFSTCTVSPISTTDRVEVDRVGKHVYNIGDKVCFLTPTKFNTKGGTVLYFTRHRITILDSKGTKIVKDASNLEVSN